ncbi:hypothetical protein FisN_29Lh062 [Fistulifera solaris]|uniref:Peptidase S1 domain-containing protein n=1 Tax=Fistulifera solaris TaxID=1519565 RepID=A0A1Z5JLX2_FISSO|nr:hypothetical protein FisN_29Lh062 [Fistulifera solaris]|eukprot:GAX14852.1 hypothetical protein FisN_29Lh062 [Fistulifera solaris]
MLPLIAPPVVKNRPRSSLRPNVFRRPSVDTAPRAGQTDSVLWFQPDVEPAAGFVLPSIIGGTPVADNLTYPYFVHFPGDDDSTCGGTLIHEDIILTVASCPAAQTANPYIGSVQWKSGSQLIVTQRLSHPEFNEISRANDIMLVKIDAPRTEPTVTIATTSRPAVNEPLRVMGFGLFNNTEFSALLLEAEINVLDFDECIDVYSERLDSNSQICAGSVTAAIGSCFDDEGGPLIHATEDIQYGIFSFTESCMSIAPQIYTDVTKYSDFIEAGICELSSNPPSSCSTTAPNQSLAPSVAPLDLPGATSSPTPPSPVESTTNTPISPIAAPLAPPTNPPFAPIAPSVTPPNDTVPSVTPPNDTAPSLTPPNDPPVTSPLQPPVQPSSKASTKMSRRYSSSAKKSNERSGKYASQTSRTKIHSNKGSADEHASADSGQNDSNKTTRSRGRKSESFYSEIPITRKRSSTSKKSSKQNGRPSSKRNSTHLVTTSTPIRIQNKNGRP